MKTCIVSHDSEHIWKECKSTLDYLDFTILQENSERKSMSARNNMAQQADTILLDLSIHEYPDLVILSVDAVKNDSHDGMLSTNFPVEIIFIRQLLKTFQTSPDDNSFKIRHEDYLDY